MKTIWRLLMFIYNLVLLLLAGVVLAVTLGRPEPLKYINMMMATTQNRIAVGIIAAAILILTIWGLIASLKGEPKPKTVVVNNGVDGLVSITIPAIKAIIMKGIKKVEGVKEIRPVVNTGHVEGLVVYMHTMLNPDYSVPETSQKIQVVVKEQLENIGGLKVHEVRVLVDEFVGTGKTTGV